MPSINACESCVFAGAFKDAAEQFAEQPSLTVKVNFDGGGSITVNRAIDPRVRAEIIPDPADVIDSFNRQIDAKPCRFVLTGICRIAEIAVNNQLKGKMD